MVIKASSAAQIRALVSALEGEDDVAREAAIARLGVIGGRAVDRLADAWARASERRTRIAILNAFERIGDDRGLPIARQALGLGGDVAVAATGVLRSLLKAANAATATSALDALVAVSIDDALDRRLRVAAFDALGDMPKEVGDRVAAALDADPNAERRVSTMAAGDAVWTDAVEGRLPDAPDDLRASLASHGPAAPLNTLRTLVDLARARERDAAPSARDGWVALRGAIHHSLALRGSSVALYDLREYIADMTPATPRSFLGALHAVGDRSCVEPLAAAWAAAAGDQSAESRRWRHDVVEAIRVIVRRERIGKRHALMKRLATKWPALLVEVTPS